MPRITEFYGIVITMHWNDHVPPHFHAEYSGARAGVLIGTGELLWGSLPPRSLRLVREWASLHTAELTANWALARASEPLVPIEPLP